MANTTQFPTFAADESTVSNFQILEENRVSHNVLLEASQPNMNSSPSNFIQEKASPPSSQKISAPKLVTLASSPSFYGVHYPRRSIRNRWIQNLDETILSSNPYTQFLLPYQLRNELTVSGEELDEQLASVLSSVFNDLAIQNRLLINDTNGAANKATSILRSSASVTNTMDYDLTKLQTENQRDTVQTLVKGQYSNAQKYTLPLQKETTQQKSGNAKFDASSAKSGSIVQVNHSPLVEALLMHGPLPLVLSEPPLWGVGDAIEEVCREYLKMFDNNQKVGEMEQPLSVFRFGSGPEAVIMLHGICMSSSFWVSGLLKHVKQNHLKLFTFFCPDLLGYGKSNQLQPQDNYSRDEQTALIFRDIIFKNKLLSYHLVGHSYGGTICLDVGSRNPKAVKTMTLFSPAYFESERQAFQILTSIPFPVSHTVAYPELGRSMIRVMNYLKPWLLPIARKVIPGTEFPELSVQDFFAIDPNATLGTVNTILHHRVERCLEILERNQVRIFVAHGDKDGVVPVRQGQAMANRYSNVVLRILPGLVHHFPVSHSRLSAEIVLHELEQYLYRENRGILHGNDVFCQGREIGELTVNSNEMTFI